MYRQSGAVIHWKLYIEQEAIKTSSSRFLEKISSL